MAHSGLYITTSADYTDLQYLSFSPQVLRCPPPGKFLLAFRLLNGCLGSLKVWHLKLSGGSKLGCYMYSQRDEKEQNKKHTIPDQDVFLCEPRAKSEMTKPY